uniref:Putative secreted protein n=1 Tax=Anopheles marajoara TaxID=58244 RepID=A0A2M4C727_9DIPT
MREEGVIVMLCLPVGWLAGNNRSFAGAVCRWRVRCCCCCCCCLHPSRQEPRGYVSRSNGRMMVWPIYYTAPDMLNYAIITRSLSEADRVIVAVKRVARELVPLVVYRVSDVPRDATQRKFVFVET